MRDETIDFSGATNCIRCNSLNIIPNSNYPNCRCADCGQEYGFFNSQDGQIFIDKFGECHIVNY